MLGGSDEDVDAGRMRDMGCCKRGRGRVGLACLPPVLDHWHDLPPLLGWEQIPIPARA